jgi:hypothetical protein
MADARAQPAQTGLQRLAQGDDVARRDMGIIAFSLVVVVVSYAACIQSFELPPIFCGDIIRSFFNQETVTQDRIS